MLTVQLHNFRKWREREITIPTTGITLLKGKSGSGKSTILNAIFWCLYGTLRKVGPLGDEKQSTKVRLDFHTNFSITRQTKPQQIKVTLNEQLYEGEVAQSLINGWFGDSDVWQMSCYIAQGQRNSFLSGTNTSRMDLLNVITFHEEDPNIKIDNLTRLLKEKHEERIKWEEHFTVLKQNFEHATHSSGLKTVDFRLIVDNQTRDVLLRQKDDLQKQIIQAKEDEKLRNQLSNEREEWRVKLSQLVAPEEPQNPQQTYTTSQLKELLQDFLLKEELRGQVAPVPEFISFTTADYDRTRLLEMDYERQQGIARNVNVDYNSDAITNKIVKLQAALDAQDTLIRWQKYCDIKSQISNLEIPAPAQDTQEFTIDDLQRTLELELAYQTQRIVAQEIGVPYEKDAIERQISIWETTLKQQEQRSNIMRLRTNMQQHEPVLVNTTEPEPSQELITRQQQLLQLRNELSQISEELPQLHQACDAVMCPQCNSALLYENGTLLFVGSSDQVARNRELLHEKQDRINVLKRDIPIMEATISRLTIQEQQRQLEYRLAVAKNAKDFERETIAYQLVLQERKRLQSLVDEMEEIPFVDVTGIPQKLARLRSLAIIEPPKYSSTDIRIGLITQEKRRKLVDLQAQLREFPSDFSQPDFPVLSVQEKSRYMQQLATLNNIVIHSLPEPSSTTIAAHIQYQTQFQQQKELQQRLANINARIGALNYADVQQQLTAQEQYEIQHKQYVMAQQRYELEHTFFIERLQKAEEKLAVITVVEVEQLQTQLTNIETQIVTSDKLSVLQTHYFQLQSTHDHLVKLVNYLAKADELKQILTKCQCELLEETVLNFNNIVDDISRDLFEDDICISLELFKSVKSTGIVKPQVNFTIVYQGNAFDNINQLSGGEGDRISLALTLGFSKLNGFPLMFFDESLAFLDQEVKNNVVESLRKMDKGIVVVMHDGVEGIFDTILEL